MLTEKCSILKRIYAFLIDFCLILLTSLFVRFAIGIPLFNVAFNYDKKCDQLIVEQVKTGLYFFVDEKYDVICNIDNNENEIIDAYRKSHILIDLKSLVDSSDNYNSDFYITGLNNFYQLYNEEFLNDKKNESDLFDNGNFKENVTEESKISFCNDIYKNVINDINLYKDKIIANLLFEISVLRIGIEAVRFFIPILIFLFIIPLCNKLKASIGQLILKLAVVDRYYVYAKWTNLLLRALTIFIFEGMLGIFTFGIVPIISFVLMLLFANGRCLHDLMSFTQVVDLQRFTPFESLKEYTDFIEKEKENRDLSLRKPYE